MRDLSPPSFSLRSGDKYIMHRCDGIMQDERRCISLLLSHLLSPPSYSLYFRQKSFQARTTPVTITTSATFPHIEVKMPKLNVDLSRDFLGPFKNQGCSLVSWCSNSCLTVTAISPSNLILGVSPENIFKMPAGKKHESLQVTKYLSWILAIDSFEFLPSDRYVLTPRLRMVAKNVGE